MKKICPNNFDHVGKRCDAKVCRCFPDKNDVDVTYIYDRPKSGMWHCGPNPYWITVTHKASGSQIRVRSNMPQHIARQEALDLMEYALLTFGKEPCSFPENIT